MQSLGNRTEDSVIDFKWSTFAATGGSITRATNGTVSVYKGNNTTQTTAGVTDTEDFDSLTGIHHCRIDTSADAFYVAGEDYQVVLSAATIDGQAVNAVIASFTLEKGFNEVDVTKWLGTAVTADTAGVPNVNAAAISGDSAAADNLEAAFDGTGGVVMKLSQLKIEANVAGQGALHCVNAHASGFGQFNSGVSGVYNEGVIAHGVHNYGEVSGVYNEGLVNGQFDEGGTTGHVVMGGTYAMQLLGSGIVIGTTEALSSVGLPGKVLGGGSGTITGVGARVVDDSGNAVANQSTLNSLGSSLATLSSYVLGGSLVAAVWAAGSRTLTSFGTLAADVWSAATRTLTAGTKDSEIDAIKAKTDSLTFTTAGLVDSRVERWRANVPGNLDGNGFVPSNAAAVNGNTTRASTLSTWLDNDRLDVAVSTRAVAGDLEPLQEAIDDIASGDTVVRADDRDGVAIGDLVGGGGDATLANQELILAKLNPVRNVVVSTVRQDRTIEIAKGADYATALGTALEWALTSVDLTGATVQMAIVTTAEYEAGDDPSWTNIGTGSVVSYSSGVNLLRVVLTDEETGALTLTTPPNDKHAYTYRLVVTLGGLVAKPYTGGLTVARA